MHLLAMRLLLLLVLVLVVVALLLANADCEVHAICSPLTCHSVPHLPVAVHRLRHRDRLLRGQ
jgi:hypothetical protein